MNKKRLLKLADHLETVPRKSFSLDQWSNDCGSVCCAVGHACSIPSFKRAGLKIETTSPILYPDKTLIFHESKDWDACADFFDLQLPQAYHLFYEDMYKDQPQTPKAVARRIRKFVKEHESCNGR